MIEGEGTKAQRHGGTEGEDSSRVVTVVAATVYPSLSIADSTAIRAATPLVTC